jgi:hypothetical protein
LALPRNLLHSRSVRLKNRYFDLFELSIPLNSYHKFVAFRRNDGKRLQPISCCVFPGVPQSSEGKEASVLQLECVRLFCCLCTLRVLRPFVEETGWDKAAPFLHRLPPCLCRRDRFCAGIDGRYALHIFQVRSEKRDQSPTRQDNFTVPRLAALPDDWLHCRRSDVEISRGDWQFSKIAQSLHQNPEKHP